MSAHILYYEQGGEIMQENIQEGWNEEEGYIDYMVDFGIPTNKESEWLNIPAHDIGIVLYLARAKTHDLGFEYDNQFEWFRCPRCASLDSHQYTEVHHGSDRNANTWHKYWSDYSAHQCNNCGHEDF